MDKKNLGSLGDAELAALERFRNRRAKFQAEIQSIPIVKADPALQEHKPLTERETKVLALKNQIVVLLTTEIHKLFSAGLDDGKLITMDIESDSGKVLSPDTISSEKLAEMSLSELNKIRFRVDILNQIIEFAGKIKNSNGNIHEILQKASVASASSYEIIQQAESPQDFIEIFCYVLTQETSNNLMLVFYALKNAVSKL